MVIVSRPCRIFKLRVILNCIVLRNRYGASAIIVRLSSLILYEYPIFISASLISYLREEYTTLFVYLQQLFSSENQRVLQDASVKSVLIQRFL